MGSPFTIIFYAADSTSANTITRECFRLVDSFNFIFSDYIDNSELSRLNNASILQPKSVTVSPALYELLVLSKEAFLKSEGAFDITIGPIIKMWRQARRLNKFPSADTIRLLLQRTGSGNMLIDSGNKTITLLKPGMQLDPGAIAKGWIAQQVINFLRTKNVYQALVNAGGDIAMSGAPPGSLGWVIGVNIPETTNELFLKNLVLQNKSVATSGDAYQFMMYKGKKYSHIINPHTGMGVTKMRNVTVIANDGATADWLATACSILSIKKAKRLCTQMNAALLIARLNHGRVNLSATKGFQQYWKHVPQ